MRSLVSPASALALAFVVACTPQDRGGLAAPGGPELAHVQDLDGTPDLIVDSHALATSWVVYDQELKESFCSLDEANLTPGRYRVLRFTVTTPTVLTTTLLADAQVRNANPTTNYGAVTTLRTREGDASNLTTYHSYLKFDVTGLSGSVVSAKLRLFATASNSTGILVYSSDSGWTETGINWNNAPLLGALQGSSGAIAQNTWVEITLPNSLFTLNQAYTLVLVGQTSQSAYFSSKEGTNKPQLILSVGP